jgi:hypothetical protein
MLTDEGHVGCKEIEATFSLLPSGAADNREVSAKPEIKRARIVRDRSAAIPPQAPRGAPATERVPNRAQSSTLPQKRALHQPPARIRNGIKDDKDESICF